MSHVYALILALYLASPVYAQQALKNPLSYSLREYGVILGIAMLGGIARWVMAVKRGESSVANIMALIGEMAISAFAGLLAFWICEAFEIRSLITYAAAGLAGHAGASGIAWMERIGQRWVEKRIGVTMPAPLRKE